LLLKNRWVAEKKRVGHEKTNTTNYVPELDQHHVCWYDKEVAKLKLLYYGYVRFVHPVVVIVLQSEKHVLKAPKSC
jgi:hypothetical protein